MWRFRLRRYLIENQVFIGIFIFGFVSMLADLLSDMESVISDFGWVIAIATAVRFFGLFVLVVLFGLNLFQRRREPIPVPLVFTEQVNRRDAHMLFEEFTHMANLEKSAEFIEEISRLRQDDLTLRIEGENPRYSTEPQTWRAAQQHLMSEWEREVERELRGKFFASEHRCYHVLPHVPLPLSFALGASVGLRRSVVLYHRQGEAVHRVLDLTKPRILLQPEGEDPVPKMIPEDVEGLKGGEKLILHLLVSEQSRHRLQFEKHPDHQNAANAALLYELDLPPDKDWLAYVRCLVHHANPLIEKFNKVEICLICPSVVAFALGMAFSRKPHLTICDWNAQLDPSRYTPVFSLRQLEEKSYFN